MVGAARPRLAKVMGLLLPLNNTNSNSTVSIEYLPCVATFDSYEDQDGNQVRYLISVNYHGVDGTQTVGSSLATFFDEEPAPPKEGDANNIKRTNLGILGVAIGAGIEMDDDVERIRTFFQTLRGEAPSLTLEVIQPNRALYATMKEETDAFKALSAEAKEEAALQQSIGPGKMAKFAHDFANGLIQEILDQEEQAKEAALAKEQELLLKQQEAAAAVEEEAPKLVRIIDTNKLRYACRKCRTILFGEDDKQDPPHVPAQHTFGYRKNNTSSGTCQSYFLADSGLDWMGDMSAMEGRFNCPKCRVKLGTWNWAGAQCSCGTWVSPAVQIPNSKVDEILPVVGGNNNGNALPSGTVIPPLIAVQQPPIQS